MPVMIQIRNVPEEIHRTLKARAAEAGVSLSDFILRELRQLADRPSPEELRARLESQPPLEGVSAADIIREHRGELP